MERGIYGALLRLIVAVAFRDRIFARLGNVLNSDQIS